MSESDNSVSPLLRYWPAIIALVILVTAGMMKWQSTFMPLHTSIPSIPLPPVNAKDIISQATSLQTATIGQIPPEGELPSAIGPGEPYQAYTPAQKEAIIRQNQPAFTKLETAFQYPYVEAPVRSFSTSFAYLAQDRALARALRIASEDCASHKDWTGAVRYNLDSIQMGSDLPHGSTLIGMLVGVACEAIGRRDIPGYIGHLNIAQSVSAARRLETIDANEQAPYETLADEEHTQCGLLELFKSNQWRRGLVSGYAAGGSYYQQLIGLYESFTESPRSAYDNYLYESFTESPRSAYDNYTNYTDSEIRVAKLPWPEQIARSPLPLPSDPVNQVLLPDFDPGLFKQYESLAVDRLLELQIALHAYKLQYGGYPASLQQLAPYILLTLPTDPFSDNQPFKYRIVGQNYLLYSIGPDAKDDGGKPIFDSSSSHKERPYAVYDASEKGDIVAGINGF